MTSPAVREKKCPLSKKMADGESCPKKNERSIGFIIPGVEVKNERGVMANYTFTVKGSPAGIAKKALEVMKRSRVKEANLQRFELVEDGGRLIALARSEGGFFHNSEVRVEVERQGGNTVVDIIANDEKTASLITRLRKIL